MTFATSSQYCKLWLEPSQQQPTETDRAKTRVLSLGLLFTNILIQILMMLLDEIVSLANELIFSWERNGGVFPVVCICSSSKPARLGCSAYLISVSWWQGGILMWSLYLLFTLWFGQLWLFPHPKHFSCEPHYGTSVCSGLTCLWTNLAACTRCPVSPEHLVPRGSCAWAPSAALVLPAKSWF